MAGSHVAQQRLCGWQPRDAAAPLCRVLRMAPPAAVPASRVEKGGRAFAVKVPGMQLGKLRWSAKTLQMEADRHTLLAPMKRGVVRVLHVETVTEADLQLPLLFMK